VAKIAIDIDDTLYDFGSVAKDALFRIANERGDKDLFKGVYSPATQWRHPNDYAGSETWMEAIRLSHQPEVILAQTPFPGAADTLNALYEHGHDLMYISNRAEEAEEATQEWLAANGFPLGHDAEVEVVCTMAAKMPLMKDCQYLIDDRPRTLVLFTQDHHWWRGHGSLEERRAFGRQTPYNENLTDLPNIYLAPSWAGIGYYLVRKGLLDKQPHEALSSTV
jgi:hypothetical protein